MLCVVRRETGLSSRSMTSEEIANFVNVVLDLNGEDAIRSHSFKSTTLSWAAKYGMDEPSRTLLGHHELQSQSLAKGGCLRWCITGVNGAGTLWKGTS